MRIYTYFTPNIGAPEFSFSGVQRTGNQEELTGTLQGMPASDLEERLAGAFTRANVQFTFRARISSDVLGSRRLMTQFQNLPGEVEIDILPDANPVRPILIDGQVSHYMTYWQQEEDRVKQNIIDEFGKSIGWAPAIRVPFVDVQTPEQADRVAKQILEGTYQPTYMG